MHLAWGLESDYPLDVEEYLGVRGTFDSEEYERIIGYCDSNTRWLIVDDLGIRSTKRDLGENCWWDRFRATSASPFEVEFDLNRLLKFAD